MACEATLPNFRTQAHVSQSQVSKFKLKIQQKGTAFACYRTFLPMLWSWHMQARPLIKFTPHIPATQSDNRWIFNSSTSLRSVYSDYYCTVFCLSRHLREPGLGIRSLVFRAICSFFVSERAIHWWKRAFLSCCSFVMSNLSESLMVIGHSFVNSHGSKLLKSLFKKEQMSKERWERFALGHKKRKNCQKHKKLIFWAIHSFFASDSSESRANHSHCSFLKSN